MALNFMLRRASSSVLPLAIRAVGSPITFHSTISPAFSVEKGSLNRSSLIPFLRFSTRPSSDESLNRVSESGIGCAEEPSEKEIPDGFPFKIQDIRAILTREYQEIDSLSIEQPEGSEYQLAYEGPVFNDLDENLQKGFHKYVEIRGIKPSATNFLHEYMINKDCKEYLHRFQNLKKFVEKRVHTKAMEGGIQGPFGGQMNTNPKPNILRPLSPHLPVYKPQLTATFSILNRISAVYLTTLLLSFYLCLKIGSISFTHYNFYLFLFYSSKLIPISLEIAALALSYHLYQGVHHLLMDFAGFNFLRIGRK